MEDQSQSWRTDQARRSGTSGGLWRSEVVRLELPGASGFCRPNLSAILISQGFRNHQITDVFDQPGSSDLTANVDFTYLSESLDGTGSAALGPLAQSRFLLSLGLEQRMSKLVSSAAESRKEDIRKGATRLIDTLGMGSQYQVMGIVPDSEASDVYPFSIPPIPQKQGS